MTLAGILDRVWRFFLANPRSTLAGLAAIGAACWPGHAQQLAEIAAGIGLILAADAQKEK